MSTASHSIFLAEHHRHGDLSFRLSTLLELSIRESIVPPSTGLDSFKKKIIIESPVGNLKEFLDRLDFFQKVLNRPSNIERLAYETVEDAYFEGTRSLEIRIAPAFITQFNKLTWEDTLYAFENGIAQALLSYPDMKVGLICIANRERGADGVAQMIEFYIRNRSRFIGLDLAGDEAGYPPHLFENEFRPLLQARVSDPGIKITIHAGEALGADSVWGAIEYLGAQRIGHGITSKEDPRLLDYLRDHEICLEICPTSNWLTNCVKTLATHPIGYYINERIPVSINTDDPGLFGKGLDQEFQICRHEVGLTDSQIKWCEESAWKYTFL